MQKPERKTNFKVTKKVDSTHAAVNPYIVFWCDDVLLDSVRGFGTIKDCGMSGKWLIDVDPRYDFDEVAEYFDHMEASNTID